MTDSRVLASRPQSASTPGRAPGYSLLLTTDPGEVRTAQRLRYRVLAGEMGAMLHTPEPGLDIDRFDAFCDHLIVREDRSGETVGTYRVLPPKAADRAGGRYADGEFDLGPLDPLRARLVEAGRACVAPEHRHGAVMNLLWTGIARYLVLTGHRWLVG